MFPVDTLKVDKSFVKDMKDDGNEFTLVGAIIAMGRSLGLDIVAEGDRAGKPPPGAAAHGLPLCAGLLFFAARACAGV